MTRSPKLSVIVPPARLLWNWITSGPASRLARKEPREGSGHLAVVAVVFIEERIDDECGILGGNLPIAFEVGHVRVIAECTIECVKSCPRVWTRICPGSPSPWSTSKSTPLPLRKRSASLHGVYLAYRVTRKSNNPTIAARIVPVAVVVANCGKGEKCISCRRRRFDLDWLGGGEPGG